MVACPVCDARLTNRSDSPDYCGEDCQGVWHAGQALPLGAEIQPETKPDGAARRRALVAA